MSTQRVERIQVRAFKAFKHLDFKLDGRHLLAYGGNGAEVVAVLDAIHLLAKRSQNDPRRCKQILRSTGSKTC